MVILSELLSEGTCTISKLLLICGHFCISIPRFSLPSIYRIGKHIFIMQPIHKHKKPALTNVQFSVAFTQTYTRLNAHTHKCVRKCTQILTAKRESAAIIMLLPLKTTPITIIGGFVCSWHHCRSDSNHYIYVNMSKVEAFWVHLWKF